MSLNVEIRIDAPQALPTIGAVETGLGRVEAKGATVSDALGKAFGNGSTAAEKAKQSTDALSDRMAKLAGTSSAFSGFADHFKRQADMLERIKGPAREYEADLRALDMLLEKNAVSTKEYADQVTNLNRRIGERPSAAPEEKHGIEGSLGNALAGQFGEVGNMLSKLASSGVVEAAALVAVTVEASRLGDEYTTLSNKALKFVDATHDTNSVLADQYQLSKDLHGGLDQTMEIYDSVRDGTDELNLSYENQIRLTKSIAEGVQLSGKSLDQAGGLMNRLSYAFASGTLSGRELKGMMREFPDIADVWTKSLGHTRKELVSMADQGTLSARDLMDAFAKAGPELDEKFGKRTETLAQQWQHFKDGIVLTVGKVVEGLHVFSGLGDILMKIGNLIGSLVGTIGKIVELSGALKILGVGFEIVGGIIDGTAKLIGKVGDAFSAIGGLWSDLTSAIGDSLEDVAKSGDRVNVMTLLAIARGRAMIEMLNNQQGAFAWMAGSQRAAQSFYDSLVNIPGEVKDLGNAFEEAGRKFGLMTDKWESSPTKFARGMKVVMDNAAKLGEAKAQIAAVNEQFNAGTLPLDEYNKKLVELTTIINGGTTPAWMVEDQLMKKAYGDMVSLNLAAGSMAPHRYHEQWKALMTTLNGGQLPAAIKILDTLNDAVRTYQNELRATEQLHKSGQLVGRDYEYQLLQLEKSNPGFQRLSEIIADHVKQYDLAAEAAKRYREAQEVGMGGVGGLQGFANGIATGQANATHSDVVIAKEADAAATAALAAREAEYLKVIEQIQSPTDKYNEGLYALNEAQRRGTISTAEYAMAVRALGKEFNTIESQRQTRQEQSLTKDWEKQLSAYQKQAEQVNQAIVQTFTPVVNGLVNMFETGSLNISEIGAQMEKVLTELAVKFLLFEALTGAGVNAKVVTGLTGISGSWAGSETTIPHAANGFSGRVAGGAGIDTKLFAAMVSPGEHISIQTPEQRTASQRGGQGGGNVTIVNKHDTRGELESAFSSGSLDTHVINVMKRNVGAVQSLIKK